MSNERARMKAAMLRADRDDAPKHTAEPWEILTPPSNEVYIASEATGQMVAMLEYDEERPPEDGEVEANAARIVACVNALAGLNPEAVAWVVKQLEVCSLMLAFEAKSHAESGDPRRAACAPPLRGQADAARAALAALWAKP